MKLLLALNSLHRCGLCIPSMMVVGRELIFMLMIINVLVEVLEIIE